MDINELKGKLPLINSDSKRTRIIGYVVYVWIGLAILMTMFPTENVASEKTTVTTTGMTDKELTENDIQYMLPSDINDPVIGVSKSEYGGYTVSVQYKDKYEGRTLQKWSFDVVNTQIDAYQKLFKDPRITSIGIDTMCKDPGTSMTAMTSEGWEDGIMSLVTRPTYNETDWDTVKNDPTLLMTKADYFEVNPKLTDALLEEQ